MRIKTSLFALSLLCMWQCSIRKEKIPPTPLMAVTGNKIVVYQMMTRLFANTRTTNKPYGTIGENGVGKMEDINDAALIGIKELGITHIWYTGIIEHALLTDYTAFGIPLDDADVVKGRAGSPYSIKDYYDINPDLAVDVKNRMLEFERLVDRTHKNGMKVVIDFVPNHVARAYHSDSKPEGVRDFGENDDRSKAFLPDNNFYYLPGQAFHPPKDYNSLGPANTYPNKDGKYEENPARVTGNDQFTATPTIHDWFEAVKLNYGVDYLNNRKTYFDSIPDTWTKMRDILLFWSGKKVDGFRCDMVQMVPVEFWHWVIPQIKAVNPDIIFIAEIYEPHLYRSYIDHGGFDFLYDKVQLYDTLRLLIRGGAYATDVHGIQKSLAGINDNMLHFLENHDEQRIASPFFSGNPWKALPGMVVSATIDKGPVMIYFGQEVGEPAEGAEGFAGNDGTTTRFDYWGVPEHQKWVNDKRFDGGKLSDEQKALRKFYADLLNFTRTNPAISKGDYLDLTWSNVALKNTSNRLVTYARAFENDRFLFVTNFSDKPEHFSLQLSPEVVAAFKLRLNHNTEMTDVMNGTVLTINPDFMTEGDIQPYGFLILKVE